MEDYEEYEDEEYEGGGSAVNKILVAVVVLLLLVIGAGCVYYFFIREQPQDDYTLGFTGSVALTQEELDAAMRQALEDGSKSMINLNYKNNAYSEDGVNFDCYIANSESNIYDIFFEIFTDEELEDKIFASGLVPRGGGYNKLKLDRALEEGVHVLYVRVSTVGEDEDGKQQIMSQLTHTMDFHVS